MGSGSVPDPEGQGAFWHVNDSIRRLANGDGSAQPWEFFCECPDTACRTLVSLTLDEFDGRRAARPPIPVLASHHDAE